MFRLIAIIKDEILLRIYRLFDSIKQLFEIVEEKEDLLHEEGFYEKENSWTLDSYISGYP